jgi:hypothetical protein
MPSNDTEGSNGLIRFVRQNQLVVFVVLAYALSWWAWIWYRIDPVTVDAPILPIGPLLAALIVLAMVGGWPAIKGLLCKIVRSMALNMTPPMFGPGASVLSAIQSWCAGFIFIQAEAF